jgi:hypothetical protein
MKKFINLKLSVIAVLATVFMLTSCSDLSTSQQKSDSGVTKATTQVKTDANGNTIEQVNIIERIKRDNEIGAVKHLYIISTYTGDVLEYSTVKGKVTSGGKRLSPRSVNNSAASNSTTAYFNHVIIGGTDHLTDEVLDDGGAYGDSGNYLYWFDAQGNYQQYYPSGGSYLHISDKPLRVRKANFTFESVESFTPPKVVKDTAK